MACCGRRSVDVVEEEEEPPTVMEMVTSVPEVVYETTASVLGVFRRRGDGVDGRKTKGRPKTQVKGSLARAPPRRASKI